MRSLAEAERLLGSGLRALAREHLRIAHLDAAGRVLGVSLSYSQLSDEVSVPVRRIAADALRLGSHALVLAHNHPSGDASPSAQDCRATARLAQTLEIFGIAVCDHLVFAHRDCRSFRALGLL